VAADLVLRGGVVQVLDVAGSTAEALAVRDGDIVAVGTDAEIEAWIGPGTEIVELAGRAVLPGINDCHLHAAWVGATWPQVFFGGAGPQPDLAARLASDDAGRRAALLRAGEIAASFGITSYTEPGIGPGEDAGTTGLMGSATLGVYRGLLAEGRLRQRVSLLMLFGRIDGASNLADLLRGLPAYDTSSPDERRFRVAGIKVFADGVPIALSSWIRSHYADGSHGHLSVDGADEAAQAAEFRAMVLAGLRAGHQVGVHATGDRSIDVFLDAVATASAEGHVGLRPYVIHGDLATPEQLDRMAGLGMGIAYQAGIGAATHRWVASVLGEGRTREGWAYRRAWDSGVPAALSSDGPFLSIDWRLEVANADRWMGPAPAPRARMLELLRAWTAIPAWIDRAESWKGTLEVGKVADLVVLARDPFLVAPAELPGVGIEATYLGGVPVHGGEAGRRR